MRILLFLCCKVLMVCFPYHRVLVPKAFCAQLLISNSSGALDILLTGAWSFLQRDKFLEPAAFVSVLSLPKGWNEASALNHDIGSQTWQDLSECGMVKESWDLWGSSPLLSRECLGKLSWEKLSTETHHTLIQPPSAMDILNNSLLIHSFVRSFTGLVNVEYLLCAKHYFKPWWLK